MARHLRLEPDWGASVAVAATVIGRMSAVRRTTQADAHPHLPAQPSERRAWLIAGLLAAAGVAVLIAVLTGAVGRTATTAPPAVLVRAATPLPGSSASGALGPLRSGAAGGSIVARPTAAEQQLERRRLEGAPVVHISRRWMEGFYPIYATAQATFGVNWLLIASIHMQESAFSTAPGTYDGLNFAHCCGGPMQFNVTNGTDARPGISSATPTSTGVVPPPTTT